jgi:hypothetical protein
MVITHGETKPALVAGSPVTGREDCLPELRWVNQQPGWARTDSRRRIR